MQDIFWDHLMIRARPREIQNATVLSACITSSLIHPLASKPQRHLSHVCFWKSEMCAACLHQLSISPSRKHHQLWCVVYQGTYGGSLLIRLHAPIAVSSYALENQTSPFYVRFSRETNGFMSSSVVPFKWHQERQYALRLVGEAIKLPRFSDLDNASHSSAFFLRKFVCGFYMTCFSKKPQEIDACCSLPCALQGARHHEYELRLFKKL